MSLDDKLTEITSKNYLGVFYGIVSQRLINEHGFKLKGDHLSNGHCPECGNNTL
jgi:hypothetical protein